MSVLQFTGYTRVALAAHIGYAQEVVVNTTDWALAVLDGATPGGFEMARRDLGNVTQASLVAKLGTNAGILVRTGDGVAARSLAATPNTGIAIANGSGTANNPTFSGVAYSTSSTGAAGRMGMVPAPPAGTANRVLTAGNGWVQFIPEYPTTSPGTKVLYGNGTWAELPAGSTSQAGIVTMADNTITQALTAADKVVTPAGIGSLVMNQTARGLPRAATGAEALARTSAEVALTPSILSAISASSGDITGSSTETTKFVTPAALASLVADIASAPVFHYALLNGTTAAIIENSGILTSSTKVSTARYNLVFSKTMPNINYLIFLAPWDNANFAFVGTYTNKTTTGVQIYFHSVPGGSSSIATVDITACALLIIERP